MDAIEGFFGSVPWEALGLWILAALMALMYFKLKAILKNMASAQQGMAKDISHIKSIGHVQQGMAKDISHIRSIGHVQQGMARDIGHIRSMGYVQRASILKDLSLLQGKAEANSKNFLGLQSLFESLGLRLKNIDRQTKNLNSGMGVARPPQSLEDLAKTGLVEIKPASESKINKEKLIYASQLPAHIFPWVIGMKSGIHAITFSPEIQSQIAGGFLNVTGGVARNSSGQIAEIGASAGFAAFAPIMLYQIGVVAFGAYHLKAINKSLAKINEKLDDISSFLTDKRSFEIKGLSGELLHISKGIIEFSKSGNLEEVEKRIHFIKHIRMANTRNLLHLQKNLQDEENYLKSLKRESWFGSEGETQAMLESIGDCQEILADYSRSLLLDIICTEIDAAFSTNSSSDEIKSRISSQKEQREFVREHSNEFDKILNKKFQELIEASWSGADTIEERRKYIKSAWRSIRKSIDELDEVYGRHIQSTEDKLKPKDNIIFLQKEQKALPGRAA